MKGHEKSRRPLLVIITGLSGSGLSTAIHALEDSGLYCIDNLPLKMIGSAVQWMETQSNLKSGFALGMDIRTTEFASQFRDIKSQLNKSFDVDVVYLTAETSILESRYTTTRRRHPFEGECDLTTAIRRERELLEPMEMVADAVIDTSGWSPHTLMRILEQRYFADIPGRILQVSVTSFGFKYGQYHPADSLYDVRFVQNPYFIPVLKSKTGQNADVQEYLLSDPNVRLFQKKLTDIFSFLLPLYYNEGKHYFRIGIGCTGGKHRSVFFAEKLAEDLKPLGKNFQIKVYHRDLNVRK